MHQRSGAVDLSEIRESLSRASLHGNYLTALCPFHEDNNPSFFVNEEYFYCMSCQKGGPTSKLLDILDGNVHTYEDVPMAKNPFNWWLKKYGTLTEAMVRAYRTGQSFPGQMDYMQDRGITSDSIKRYRLGWMDGWITFPALDKNNRVTGATARLISGNARYMTPHGQDKNVLFVPDWRLNTIFSYLYIVFGIVDALTLAQQGYPVVTTMVGVGVSDPTPYEDFRKPLYVLPDRGEADRGAKLVRNLGWRGKLFTPDWPEGCKDINDVYCRDGELLKNLMATTPHKKELDY